MNDQFLEEFPLTSAELDSLLMFHSKYHQGTRTKSHGENKLNNLSDWIDQLRSPPTEAIKDSSSTSLLNQLENNVLPPKLGLELIEGAIAIASIFTFSPTSTVAEDEDVKNKRLFLEAMVTCLGRRGPRPVLQLLHGCACKAGRDNETKDKTDSQLADTSILIDMTYRLALASHILLQHSTYNMPSPEVVSLPPSHEIGSPLAMIKSLSFKENCLKSPDHRKVSLSTWLDWATWTAPQLYTASTTFMHTVLFTRNNSNSRNLENNQDVCGVSSSGPHLLLLPSSIYSEENNYLDSSFWNTPHDIIPFLMATLSCSLQGSWQRLYSSLDDGHSFLRLEQALLGYKGPTVLLIRTTDEDEFGYYTECPWKLPLSPTQKWFFGGEGRSTAAGMDSFLFRLSPELALYPSTGQGCHYMYLNPSSATSSCRRHLDEMFGLAVGGFQPDCPRVYLTEDFENCCATSVDTTYESGPLLSDDRVTFDVDVVEAWAVASVSATQKAAGNRGISKAASSKSFFETCREGGRQEEDIRESRRLHVAHVDRTQFLEDFRNGNVVSDIFRHRDQVRGRADFEVDELHGGYVLEEFKSQDWEEEDKETQQEEASPQKEDEGPISTK